MLRSFPGCGQPPNPLLSPSARRAGVPRFGKPPSDPLMFHPSPGRGSAPERQADVAQLVAHHLAKVRVAGSNPVVRSERPSQDTCGSGSVEWPRGEATACKAVYTGSNPVSTSARYYRGRLAQRERASLTRKRSLVRSQYRPPSDLAGQSGFRPSRDGARFSSKDALGRNLGDDLASRRPIMTQPPRASDRARRPATPG